MGTLRIEHPVPDYAGWKQAFDSDPANRRQLGVRRYQILRALEEYDGTAVVISHDRYFLDRIVDRIVEIRDGEQFSFDGGYTAWNEAKEESRREPERTLSIPRRAAR